MRNVLNITATSTLILLVCSPVLAQKIPGQDQAATVRNQAKAQQDSRAEQTRNGRRGAGRRGPEDQGQGFGARQGPQSGPGAIRRGPRPNQNRPQNGLDALFRQFDQNDDGLVTFDEVPQNGRQRLALMDTNGDGGCDRSELDAAMRPPRRPGQQSGQAQQNGRTRTGQGQQGMSRSGGQQGRRRSGFGGGQLSGGSNGQARGGRSRGGGQARGGGRRGR